MKLNHPTLPDVTRDVPADQVDAWLEQGWIDPDAPAADLVDEPSTEPAADDPTLEDDVDVDDVVDQPDDELAG